MWSNIRHMDYSKYFLGVHFAATYVFLLGVVLVSKMIWAVLVSDLGWPALVYICDRLSCCFLFSSPLLKSRLPAIKVKYLLLAWLGILIASWVIYMQYASYSELCRGHVCHMVIVSMSLWTLSTGRCHNFISVTGSAWRSLRYFAFTLRCAAVSDSSQASSLIKYYVTGLGAKLISRSDYSSFGTKGKIVIRNNGVHSRGTTCRLVDASVSKTVQPHADGKSGEVS